MNHVHTASYKVLAPAWLLLAIGAYACVPTEPASPGSGSFHFFANVSGAGVATLVVEVTADDIESQLVFNLEVDETGIASDTILILVGTDREITVRGYNANRLETHRGRANINVTEGLNPPLVIRLEPLIGDVPIDVTFGRINVIIDPPEASITVGFGVRLTAVVLDAKRTVLDVPVRWSSVSPWVAMVDGSGFVTGVSGGEAEILASFGGESGAAVITVGIADEDGDGVLDGDDLCTGTPANTPIDASGCAVDMSGTYVGTLQRTVILRDGTRETTTFANYQWEIASQGIEGDKLFVFGRATVPEPTSCMPIGGISGGVTEMIVRFSEECGLSRFFFCPMVLYRFETIDGRECRVAGSDANGIWQFAIFRT